MSSPYSPLKIVHHPWHVQALRTERPIAPVFLQLIPTNVCSHRCNFCAYRTKGYSSNETFDPRESIPWPKLSAIIDDCKTIGVRAIEVTGGGEPTCHPQFLDLCRKTLDCGLDLGIVSNGSHWTEEHAEATKNAKWVRFSIDAGSPITYLATHRTNPGTYEKVREAVKMQAATKHPDQLVGVSFTVTKDNWPEILQAAQRAKEDGADNIRISACFQDEGAAYFNAFYAQASLLCREAAVLTENGFQVFNCFDDRVQDLKDSQPNYHHCHFQKVCTYIGADQNLYRCCVVAYNHVGLLGSIKEQGFREAWFSPDLQQKLRGFNPHSCPRCMFNNKNRTIDYLLDPDPSHVNFV